MTDSIDLDEIDAGEEESDENDGDWFWNGDGDPPADSGPAEATPGSSGDTEPDDSDGTTVGTGSPDAPAAGEPADADAEDAADESGGRIPHVPYDNKNQPAGIPVEQGGSGGGAAQSGGQHAQAPADKGQMQEESQQAQASGPHGGDADDMTTAFTLGALRRIENVQRALADTDQWSDWIGIVGDVGSHEIQKFQRDNQLDVDFFNGTGSGPAERLAEIDRTSMFYANRMVVIGVEGEEWFATDDEWEFVPLVEAAAGADWEIAE